jgi:integrase/recombinase XerC
VHERQRVGIDVLITCARGRWKALLLLMATTGCRLSEARNLTWTDIDRDTRTIHIRAKNGWTPKNHQNRALPAGDKLLAVLRHLRERPYYAGDDDYVFAGSGGHGRPPSMNYALHHLQVIFRRAGLYKKGCVSHLLRHTAATEMLVQGVDLVTVQNLLGHSDVTVTQLYAHPGEQQKRAAAKVLEI